MLQRSCSAKAASSSNQLDLLLPLVLYSSGCVSALGTSSKQQAAALTGAGEQAAGGSPQCLCWPGPALPEPVLWLDGILHGPGGSAGKLGTEEGVQQRMPGESAGCGAGPCRCRHASTLTTDLQDRQCAAGIDAALRMHTIVLRITASPAHPWPQRCCFGGWRRALHGQHSQHIRCMACTFDH